LVELPPSKIRVSELNVDPELRPLADDPRIDSDGVKHRKERGGARNTESFDPASTLVRPDMRIIVGPKQSALASLSSMTTLLSCPIFSAKKMIGPCTTSLSKKCAPFKRKGVPQSEWTAWAEGAHLISHNPSQSATFQMVFSFFMMPAFFEHSATPNSPSGSRKNIQVTSLSCAEIGLGCVQKFLHVLFNSSKERWHAFQLVQVKVVPTLATSDCSCGCF
jgi:hypothetical protein